MDALHTGNVIAEHRKQQNLTQKELAELLGVTDKAVSKWERGLNFPDISLLEKVASALQISVVELLGIERDSHEEIVSDMTALARKEQEKIVREIRIRAWINVILGIVVLTGSTYASKVLADHGLYGLPQISTMGMYGFIGTIIGNGLWAIQQAKQLMK